MRKYLYKNCDKSLIILVFTYLIFLGFIVLTWPTYFSQSREIQNIESLKDTLYTEGAAQNAAPSS